MRSNLSMVIGDELKVRQTCSDAFPAGERLRVYHNASKLPVRLNERIDLCRQSLVAAISCHYVVI
jgi:hypothetical protein